MAIATIDDLMFLPQPESIEPRDGRFELVNGTRLIVPGSVAESEKQALGRFVRWCNQIARRRVDLRFDGQSDQDPGIRVTMDPAGAARERDEGYHLVIGPGRVHIHANDGAGLFYGIQTLIQIARSAGTSWPSLAIDDAPAFAVRGFHLDVSRGRVPTLATLKGLVERLAHFKINQLQLYIEHTFAFAFNPRISEGCSPLTPDEVRELDAWCRLHRIELVPSLASFGHMARILSLPEYRHLAEVPLDKEWEEIPWADRTRGLTLDTTNPESRKLLESMYDEIVPLCSGGWVNVCCDETHDLGRGRGKARADAIGPGRLYLEHLRWLGDLCGRYGKRMMYWGDIIRNHPDLLKELPDRARVLHWSYGPNPDCDTTKRFCDAGLDTVACPSTMAWARFLSGINTAEANIRAHAGAARRCGGRGLLNTEWGDGGHVNMLTGSWHPIAVGAAVSWNVGRPEPEAFDRAFAFLLFGDRSGSVSRAMRRVARLHDEVADWRVLRAPFDDRAAHEPIDNQAARRLIADARSLRESLASRPADDSHRWAGDAACGHAAPSEIQELVIATDMCERVGEKVLLARALADSSFKPDALLRDRLGRFADELARATDEFSAVWLARNKPSELHAVVRALEGVIAEARAG